MPDCNNCTEKCPQAGRAHQTALGRMYATNEFTALLKKVENGELVSVVRCKDCKHSKVFTVADDPMYNHLRCCRRENYTEGVDGYDFCSYGEKGERENDYNG